MKESNTYLKLKNKPVDNFAEMIIVHHSGGTDLNPLEDTSHHTASIMEKYHVSLGWEGLGYHYVIHKDGEVWRGRPEHYHGAHTTNYNNKSIGICLAGNFDATFPTKEQENSLAGLIASIKTRYPVEDRIYPHRKFANKTCYGNKLTNDWAKNLTVVTTLKTEIRQKLAEVGKLVEKLPD